MGQVDWSNGQPNNPIFRMIATLSTAIECCVTYPTHGVPIAKCKCGVMFPLYLIRTGDWSLMRRRHDEEKIIAEES